MVAISFVTQKSKLLRFFGKILGFTAYTFQAACITHCTFEYIGDFVMCSGPSMEPTLKSDDVLLTEHISPRYGGLSHGDIVIAKNPSDPKQYICKRIAGLPGDVVRTNNIIRREQIVPRGHVWLEGDNSSNSADSRIYGAVPQGLIRSRAILKIWPLSNMEFLS